MLIYLSDLMKEKRSRSIVKTISWRIIATLTTTILVYIFTGNFTIAIRIGFLEIISKLIFYYLHERVWNNIKWGSHST